jgi:hypothetical protein
LPMRELDAMILRWRLCLCTDASPRSALSRS